MGKIIRKGKSMFLLLACLLVFPAGHAQAAWEVSVSVPVKQVFETTGEVPDHLDQTFCYQVTAQDKNSPLPDEAQDGVYFLELTGNETKEAGSFVFTHGGVYRYEICLADGQKGEGFTCDSSVYQLLFYVKNGPDGSLIPQIVVKDESGNKLDEISFQHAYLGRETGNNADAGTQNQAGNVKTGDQAEVLLWCALGLVSMALILTAGWSRRRNKEDGK